ncbi:MAG TPA: hypothetical protein PLE99_08925 [Candidatus Thiothrix moscowensis]|uniref:hypothetical protein n=1 Tax=unclassified Thiothrix TaxID=2636184 RepID=UPI001A257F51|nr:MULTISPECIES: hypothetical protein [unclassified Thiothrix]MBJ6609995.1 response regulator transcription factor [Candidatus Thiothrix moscowensis]HRJ52879.1 hypothetical protein [Candidatus Thiothrix moscowensis]HRJ93429.1 hypothetical protein [Candidatus Thiothrix moscowensis]
MHILVICGFEGLRFYTTNLLREAGFVVTDTACLTQAIASVSTIGVDAAIIGPAAVPDEEVSLIQSLRQHNLWFPLIAVSRCERWSHISNLLTAGADEYIQEPFTTASLLGKLEKLLHYSPLRKPRELKLNAGFGTIRVHNLGQQVYINDTPAKVSSYDYLMLKCIAQNLGEDGLTPHNLLSLHADQRCGRDMAEAAEHLLQRIHP